MGGRVISPRGTPEEPLVLSTPHNGGMGRELIALALLATALFAGLSLLAVPLQTNFCGPWGQALATALVSRLGLGAVGVCLLAGWIAWRIWRALQWLAVLRLIAGGAIALAALIIAAGLAAAPATGGQWGFFAAAWLVRSAGISGAYLAVGLGFICGTAVLTRRPPTDLVAILAMGLSHALGAPWRQRRDGIDRESPLQAVPFELGLTHEELPVSPAPRGAIELLASMLWSKPEEAGPGRAAAKPRVGKFKLPPLALLDTPPSEHTKVDESVLQRSAQMLEQKLGDFGVEGQVVAVQPGPVVTMYKFEPASGIKVSQIVNLADDLSMALRALAIRIQAPVPGEAVVGIEVPNRKRDKIYLREILESGEFAAARSHLTIALGKDIAGQPVVADLARMPHLLIAGATGTGKSVSIHTMISSILFNATADDVRFILIDPKMLELSVYEHIPHLLVPVLVDPDKAAAALLWAVQEMERRYRVMRDMAVRNIDGYNQAIEAGQRGLAERGQLAYDGDPNEAPIVHQRMPKLVIVIDELADLILTEGKNVERDITRLAQKARAAGIHLLLATQRPSVDVLTGLIKANLPARISLQTASRVDSRTILDNIGAERLLGEGDMLFMPPGTAKLRRLHGPFVSENEIRKVTDYLRRQGSPTYQMEILETARGDTEEGEEGGERDAMYDEAVRIVTETNQASISMIQRRLRVGYNRAARMVEQMEREGLVTPADGARPREVRIGSHRGS